MSYADSYNRSIADPEGFWAEAATGISWDRPWEKVVDLARPNFPRWFAGARLNTCFNALDRHVASGRGAQTALIHDSPVTGTIRHLSYTEMLDQTARFAGGYGTWASKRATGS